MKKTFLLCISTLLIFSCDKEDFNEGEKEIIQKEDLENNLNALGKIPRGSDYDLEVAWYYAPFFLQDMDKTDGLCSNQSLTGASDWITRVNYDGDWNTKNNWENLLAAKGDGSLYPVIYYNIAVTQTQFYILYAAYHPRDWTDVPLLCSKDSHENDMEGVLIVAKRESDGSFGPVQKAVTKFHTGVKKYNASELIITNTNDGPSTKIFIEAKGHGMRKYKGSSDEDGTWIKYIRSVTGKVPDRFKDTQTLTYQLQSTKALWDRRNNTTLFSNAKAFVGDNGEGSNKASAPWGWEGGTMAKDPANYIKSLFNLPSTYKTTYIRERYIK